MKFTNQGKVILTARTSAGLTQKEMASMLGWSSPQFISNIERGLSAFPPESVHAIRKIVQPKTLKSAYMVDVSLNWNEAYRSGKKK